MAVENCSHDKPITEYCYQCTKLSGMRPPHADSLVGALEWLLDDLLDAGLDRIQDGDPYDSVTNSMEVLSTYKELVKMQGVSISGPAWDLLTQPLPTVPARGTIVHGILLNSNDPDSEDRKMLYILERPLPPGYLTADSFESSCETYFNGLMNRAHTDTGSAHIENAVVNVDDLLKHLKFEGFDIQTAPGDLFDFDRHVESMESQ